jgi:hypothetical protein
MPKDQPRKPPGTTAAAVGRAAGAAAAGAGVAGVTGAAAAAGAAAGAIHETQQINTQTADPGPLIPKEAWLDAEQRAKGVQDLIGGLAGALLGVAAGAAAGASWASRVAASAASQAAADASQAAAQQAFEDAFSPWGTGSQAYNEMSGRVLGSRAWSTSAEDVAAETALADQENLARQELARLFPSDFTDFAGTATADDAVIAAQAAEARAIERAAETLEAATQEAAAADAAVAEAAVPTFWEAVGFAGLIAAIVWGEMGVLGAFAHWMASDPPDSAFHEVYRPRRYGFPPVTVPGTTPPSLAAALGAALASQLGSVSLCQAVLVSLERYQGAKAASDDVAANRQLVAYLNYSVAAAQALAGAARLVEDFTAAGRAWGQPDVVVTADQVRMGQRRLASDGLPGELRAVFAWLGVSEELLNDVILPGVMSVDPEKAAGGYEEKLREQAALYRQISAALTSSSPRECWVGNPHDREETIDLLIRPVSMPPDWKVRIANAEQAGTAGQGKSGRDEPEFPVREIEAGKHYAVTLPAKRQVKLLTMLTPAGAMGAHTTTRWSVEGRIGDELLGGVVHEMTLP